MKLGGLLGIQSQQLLQPVRLLRRPTTVCRDKGWKPNRKAKQAGVSSNCQHGKHADCYSEACSCICGHGVFKEGVGE